MRTCVSVVERSLQGALSACEKAVERGADLVEIRFDLMDAVPLDLSGFRKIGVPKIATLRRRGQGGDYEGEDADRLSFFIKTVQTGFEFIDLEHDSVLLHDREKLLPAKIICSYHDFSSTPQTSAILDILIGGSSKGDVSKAAFQVGSVSDLLRIVNAARLFTSAKRDFSIIGMGGLGEITRIKAGQLGCAWTYASLEEGKEAAPGQISIDAIKKLGDQPVIAGLVGGPVAHSISPIMHNAAFREMGIPGRYLLFPTKEEELAAMLELMRELDLRGLNVTIPHKETVAQWLDRLDPSAESAGAVNVVTNEEGELIGMNTDVYGVRMTFEKAGIQVSGMETLVVGAGGAAKAVCSYLREKRARIHVVNRTKSKAERIAEEFGGLALEFLEAEKKEFELVINCTPVGMSGFPEGLPISPSVFRKGQVVMDVIYNPLKTPFLLEAEKRGAITLSGVEMLIYQAMDAFAKWTGRWPPYETMAGAAKGALT